MYKPDTVKPTVSETEELLRLWENYEYGTGLDDDDQEWVLNKLMEAWGMNE